MNESAGSTLELEMVGHLTVGASIRKSILGIPDPEPDPPKYDLKVKVRSSGAVVYSMRRDAGVDANEGMRQLEEDLETLTLEAFSEKYGFPVPR